MAVNKRKKATKKPSSVVSQQEGKLSKQEAKENLRHLDRYCKRNGWEVIYEPHVSEEYTIAGKIKLRSTRKTEVIFYMFLHELGHMLMRVKDRSYRRRYAIIFEGRYATDTYKITRVQEEMEAWDVGLRFARARGLKINDRKFQKVRAECLMTYLQWATRRKTNVDNRNKFISSSPTEYIAEDTNSVSTDQSSPE